MSKAIRKARNAFQIGAALYQEIAVSAFTLFGSSRKDARV